MKAHHHEARNENSQQNIPIPGTSIARLITSRTEGGQSIITHTVNGFLSSYDVLNMTNPRELASACVVSGMIAMAVIVTSCEGLYLPKPTSSLHSTFVGKTSHRHPTTLFVSSGYGMSSSHQEEHDQKTDMEEMRRDIASMKKEALKRLEELNRKMADYEATIDEVKLKEEQEHEMKRVTARMERALQSQYLEKKLQETKDDISLSNLRDMESEFNLNAMERRMESDQYRMEQLKRDSISGSPSPPTAVIEATSASTNESATSRSPSISLLDETRWRLMYNLGREPGTWMAKSWGESGERLHMNLEVEFMQKPLIHDKDDFLNGQSNAKVLHVVNNELTIGPNMKEGSKSVRVKDGGWRVGRGEGPAQTDVLRFYIEVEEMAGHTGSDVYCPAGRLYCTCGYFPMESRTSSTFHQESLKDEIRNEQKEVKLQYDNLQREMDEDTSIVSLDKIRRAKKMIDLQEENNKLRDRLQEARIKEPERRSLRLSQDLRVGLTKEGGVCCKVNKGLAIEYHILGKFELASMANREHSDYRELLP